jgi:glutamate 5-kinase
MSIFTRQDLPQAKSIVVKIGSGVLVRDGVQLDRGTFCRLVEQIAGLITLGYTVTVVSSGAVALGRSKLNVPKPDRASALPRLQALAAVGQTRLMQLYETEFEHYGLRVGQVLFNRDDLDNRTRYLNARRTLRELNKMGCIPIINENDTVTNDEIRFGDNDHLAARVASLLDVDLFIILSDIDALYTANPRVNPDATPIDTIAAEDPSLLEMATDTHDLGSGVGTGGMITKIRAAQIAARTQIPTIITSGKHPERLPLLLSGAAGIGTLLTPPDTRQPGRKVWLERLRPHGSLRCDEGACLAVRDRGKSLLPGGIITVDGNFIEGDAVEITDAEGVPFAIGLAAYPAADLRRIAGHHTDDIHNILGYRTTAAAIHRNDMVLISTTASA